MNYRHRLLIRHRPIIRFVKFRILHIDDTPQAMARGLAVGFFVAYLPLFGLHMLLALLIAAMIRANKALAVMAVWICNPLTFAFIYYPSYRIGQLVLSFSRPRPQVELDQIQELLNQTFSLKYMLMHLFSAEYWKQIASVFTQIGLETLIGGVILGTIAAKIGYWIGYYFIIGYRTRKQARRTAWKRAHNKS